MNHLRPANEDPDQTHWMRRLICLGLADSDFIENAVPRLIISTYILGMMMEAPSTSAPLPPGGLFEIVFSFDTTGSMSSVIDEVKGRLQDMIQRLQADIPGIRFGVLAHGDYCDEHVFYLEKHIDLTQDIKQLCDFVTDVDGTGGGDPEECYELVLNLARTFSWTPGSQRALVMIGDSEPHAPDYGLNKDNIDWREEAKVLAAMVSD